MIRAIPRGVSTFKHEIEFESDFTPVTKDAEKIGAKVDKGFKLTYDRVLERLAGVQDRLARITDTARAGFSKVAGGVAKVGGAAASAAGVAAQGLTAAAGFLGGELSRVIEQADALGDSKVFDVETYQRLAAAAKYGGVEIKDLEAASVQLNDTLNKAQVNPIVLDTLKKVGLSLDDIRKQDPETQFQTLADAIAKIEDPTEQVLAASNLLGKGLGPKLLPFLRQGGDGLKGFSDAAEKAGLIISQDTVDAAGAIADGMDILEDRWEGLKTGLVSALIPRIATGVTWLAENITGALDTIGPFVLQAGDAFGAAADVVLTGMSHLEPVAEALGNAIGMVLPHVLNLTDYLTASDGVIVQVADMLAAVLVPAVETAGEILAWVAEDIAPIVFDIFGDVVSVVTDLVEWITDWGDATDTAGGIFETVGGVIADLVEGALSNLQAVLQVIVDLFDTFTEGSWEESFAAMGRALLDFVLEPLRSIVSTVVTIADAISEDLVPQSVRDFAQGGGIREIVRENTSARISKRELAAQRKDYERRKKEADRDAAKKRRDTERAATRADAAERQAASVLGRKKKGAGKKTKDTKETGLQALNSVLDIRVLGPSALPGAAPVPVTSGKANASKVPAATGVQLAPIQLAVQAPSAGAGASGKAIPPVQVTFNIHGTSAQDIPALKQTLEKDVSRIISVAVTRALSQWEGHDET